MMRNNIKLAVRVDTPVIAVLLLFSNKVFSQPPNDAGDDLLLSIPALVAAIKKGNSGFNTSPPGSSINASCPPNATMVSLFNQTNAARATSRSCGIYGNKQAVAALSWNCKLADAADRHSRDMYNNQFFSHTGSDGSSMVNRVEGEGYDWDRLAENIAWGYTSVSSVMADWLDSDGHCKNIMKNDVIHMGAARVGNYWTVVFGRGQ